MFSRAGQIVKQFNFLIRPVNIKIFCLQLVFKIWPADVLMALYFAFMVTWQPISSNPVSVNSIPASSDIQSALEMI